MGSPQKKIISLANQIIRQGVRTIVLQSGDDFGFSQEILSEIIKKIKKENPLVAITLSFCQTQFDRNQAVIQRKFNLDYNLPSFYYPELLSLALGVEPEKLGFNLHRVKVEPILEKIL